MKALLLLLLAGTFLSANATTYYFSSNSGDDSRSSSQARNPSTPWRSLNKLNAIFGSLQPGDAVLLKRGETFYGSITIHKSGSSGSPITIGAYGSGNKPVITSLAKLSGWVSKGKGIFESYNSALGSTVNAVLLNGADQELGRYPNHNGDDKGYLHYEGHNGNSITDNEMRSSPNWTGADVVIRLRRWILDRNPITSHSGSKISFSPSSHYVLWNSQGYFIENSIKTLDKLGEWYYNSSSKKLSVYFGSNSPSSYSVQATTKDDLIHAEKSSNLVFDNLVIKGANSSGIYIKFGSNIRINNCDIELSGANGISAYFHPNLKIENSTISDSHNDGIDLGYTGDNAIIRNNKITNTAMFAGMLRSGDGSGLAIHSNGSGSMIEYNEIRNTGYIGLTFNGNNTTVKNNIIDGFCLTKDDGSGIYSSSRVNYKGRKVIGNIVINGKGENQGTSWKSLIAEGIYFDNNAGGIEINGNTVANCANQGVYLHNAHTITIKNNTIFNSGSRQLSMIEMANHTKIRNCIINNNIFFSTRSWQKVLNVGSDDNDINLFGKFSGNSYARPSDDQNQKTLTKVRSVENNANLKTFTTPIRFEYNPTAKSKTIRLDANYADVKNNKYSGSVTLQPFTSVVLIRTGAASPGSSSPTVSITSPAQNTSFKAYSTININATASDAGGSITKVEFYNGSKLLQTENKGPYTYSWKNVPAGNYKITAKATDNNNNVTTSAIVSVSVTNSSNSSYPAVRITSPSANTNFKGNSDIKMTASASDAGGSIKKVEFYNGNTLLQAESDAPFEFVWKNVPNGNYTLIAKATDNSGNVTTSARVPISVSSSSSYPSVTMTSPKVNSRYNANSKVYMSADASVRNGSISKVDFYNGSTLLRTEYKAPYEYNWRYVRAGNYTLTAKATDNNGHVTTSSKVTISVVASRGSDNDNVSSMVNNSDTISNKVISDKAVIGSVDFSLFPNPAVNTIKISFANTVTNKRANIAIINMSGSVQKNISAILSDNMEVDVSSLSVGTYILKVAGEGFTMSKKFIKIN